jgi:tetratricopeptide (TPR) repeat protein
MGLALVAALVAAGQTSSGKRESDVWTERGRVALAEYRYHDAAEAFQKVIAISPDLAAAHAQLARALLGEAPPNPLLFPDTNGFLPKAEAEARKAVDLSPADPEALSTLASVDHKLADSTRDPAEKSVRLAEVAPQVPAQCRISQPPLVLESHSGLRSGHNDGRRHPLHRDASQFGVSLGAAWIGGTTATPSPMPSWTHRRRWTSTPLTFRP